MDAERLQELFEPFGRVSIRRMFGGAGIYNDGVMFALLADGQIYLKANPEAQARFREAGCRPFVYESRNRRVETSYWSVPEAALDDAEMLREWAGLAYAAALSARRSKAVKAGKTGRS